MYGSTDCDARNKVTVGDRRKSESEIRDHGSRICIRNIRADGKRERTDRASHLHPMIIADASNDNSSVHS